MQSEQHTKDYHHTGSSYINSGSVEAHCLQQYGQSIMLLLTESAQYDSLPLDWVENITTEFTILLTLIDERWMSAKDECINCLMFNT